MGAIAWRGYTAHPASGSEQYRVTLDLRSVESVREASPNYLYVTLAGGKVLEIRESYEQFQQILADHVDWEFPFEDRRL